MAEEMVLEVSWRLNKLLSMRTQGQIKLPTGFEEEAVTLRNLLKESQFKLIGPEAITSWTRTERPAWMQDLGDILMYNVRDVLDEWRTITDGPAAERVCLFNQSSPCFGFTQIDVPHDVVSKVEELNARLGAIKKEWGQSVFDIDSHELSGYMQDELEIIGRISDKDTLLNQLLSQQAGEGNAIPVLSITGAGGIGKTILSLLVYDNDLVTDHFQRKVWVCLSNLFDEAGVLREIAACLDEHEIRSTSDSRKVLLAKIKMATLGERCLFVLDDAWLDDHESWSLLKRALQYGAPGSAILLTTRSKRVARAAGATSTIHLGALSESDSWSLFQQVALSGRSEIQRERLENIGRSIARKCEGLPIAITALGRHLHHRDTVEDWQQVMESNIWELQVVKTKVFPCLFPSYNNLSFPMRQCFSYCAVFPKGKEINVDDLIKIWMAQGYLDPRRGEYEGRKYFEHLAADSFFQDYKHHEDDQGKIMISCKMHAIMHHFAQYLRRGECLMISNDKRQGSLSDQNVHHLTWLGNGKAPDALPEMDMTRLRSFFAKNLELEALIDQLFKNLKLVKVLKLDRCGGPTELSEEIGNLTTLRYLSLGFNKLKELPVAVSNLKNLQTLNLQGCSYLKELPVAVYKLKSLQTLNLQGCSYLKVLPSGIEKLTKLRHLIHDVYDMKYPTGIGELNYLKTLPYFSVGKESNEFKYLEFLNKLQGFLEITIMDDLDSATASLADLKSKRDIQSLTFSFEVKENDVVMEALEPCPDLPRLTFRRYGGTQLPKWITSLSNLKRLALMHFFKMTSLPHLGILPQLEKLQIRNFSKLKQLDVSFLKIINESSPPPQPEIAFPKLEELQFVVNKQWEEWEDIGDNNTVQVMPCLRRLIINKCPKLKALPNRLLRKARLLECIEFNEKEYDPSTILSGDLTLLQLRTGGQTRLPDLSLENGPKLCREQLNEDDCKYYLRTGFCCCGACCHFYHPTDCSKAMGATSASGTGCPERVGQPICQMTKLSPTAPAPEVHPGASSSTQPTAGASLVDNATELSPAYTGHVSRVSSRRNGLIDKVAKDEL